MKQKYFTIILLVLFLSCQGNESALNKVLLEKPEVAERVELLSIVARLAGYPEYSNEYFKLYTDKINSHFSPYKDHEVIRFAQKLRSENGVSHDAVMAMAVYLDENLNPRAEFTDEIPERRWRKENADEFVRLLKAFYTDAKCQDFFSENKDLYKEACERFQPVYESINLDWFSAFYGKEPSEKFIIINALGNGGSNYGGSFNVNSQEKEVYAFMGAWTVDGSGMVSFNKDDYFLTLIHEFSHSFINHFFINDLLVKDESPFRDNGEQIFEVVKDKMSRQAYNNWRTVLNEALVRACVIKYMKDNNFGEDKINAEINSEKLSCGFIWIDKLVEELDKYDRQRNIYPTLESYMPRLADVYKDYAAFVQEYETKRPKVVSINEFTNGDNDVNITLTKITINFDTPLSDKGYSIYYGQKGKEAFPEMTGVKFSEDKKSVILELKPLEKDKEYQFVLNGMNFKSPDGVSIKDYEINFKTGG